MRIRDETEQDRAAVKTLNESAFETPAEATLVEALREQARPVISLVASDPSGIVGHIMFSPVTLRGHAKLKIMGLAPMAISREHQRKGIGSALVFAGLEQCRRLDYGAVVVLGHPEYYPRFGFRPATEFELGCDYEVPEDTFMAVELRAGYLDEASGKIEYHPAFNEI